MKVRGDLAPSAAFTLEKQPKNPGFSLARFYENVRPFEETTGDQTMSGFEYDEYHLELADTGNLQDDIFNNYDYYMGVAKLQELVPEDDGDVGLEEVKEHVANLTLAVEIMLGVYDDEL